MGIVDVRDLTVHSDDRGNLFEILRDDDKEYSKFGQVYLVEDRQPNVVRAFHRHFELTDWFTIVSGAAKFVFFKAPKIMPTMSWKASNPTVVYIDSRRPKLITVPPTVWHGWMSLEPNTRLISVASHSYNAEKPDEERCDPYIFGKDVWKIKAM